MSRDYLKGQIYKTVPYYEIFRIDRKKDNLNEILISLDYFNLKCAVSMLTINELTNTLNKFSVKDDYPDELRALFFAINEELTRRNIAPMWRNIIKAAYTNPKSITAAQKRYFCDMQIIDLLWIHSKYHGHKIKRGDWYKYFDGIFENGFDYMHADDIANTEFTFHEKITTMKLKDNIQLQLIILHSDKIKKRIERAIKAHHIVETHIHDAADRNPRKGKKVSEQAEVWSKTWLCRKLAGSSPRNIASMYYQMTGNTINLSVLRNKMVKITAALYEVKSPYYKDMLIKK